MRGYYSKDVTLRLQVVMERQRHLGWHRRS
jgi:hypothetical protein